MHDILRSKHQCLFFTTQKLVVCALSSILIWLECRDIIIHCHTMWTRSEYIALYSSECFTDSPGSHTKLFVLIFNHLLIGWRKEINLLTAESTKVLSLTPFSDSVAVVCNCSLWMKVLQPNPKTNGYSLSSFQTNKLILGSKSTYILSCTTYSFINFLLSQFLTITTFSVSDNNKEQ